MFFWLFGAAEMSFQPLIESQDPHARDNALSSNNMTFSISDEDHSLGNALRAMLCKRLDVEFAGYTIPHPTKAEINLRLQTMNKPAVDVLESAINDLFDLFSHIEVELEKELGEK